MSSENYGDQGLMEVTGRVLISTIIALVVVLILVVLFHIYAKWLWHRRQQNIDSTNNRGTQDHHAAAGVTVLRRGLDPAFLKTLPVSRFDSKQFSDKEEGGLECSVCLSEVEEGERTRVLPKCNHVFHAECIDMWFHSHSTCPICRNPVSQVSVESFMLLQQDNHIHEREREEANINISISISINGGPGDIPTNVLFWGDETEVSTLTSQLEEANHNHNHQATTSLPFEEPPATAASSSSSSSSWQSSNNNNNKDRMKPDLVIDIPRRQVGEEEQQDQITPIMRSLRRILSSSTRFNPFSPGAEQVQT